MPADAAQRMRPLIARLVKFWSEMKSLLLLAAVMAVINSCLLCCCGPLTPFVLQVVANMSVVHWGFRCCSAANQRDSSLSAWPSEACLWFCPKPDPAAAAAASPPTAGNCGSNPVQAGHIWGPLSQVRWVLRASVIYHAEDLFQAFQNCFVCVLCVRERERRWLLNRKLAIKLAKWD